VLAESETTVPCENYNVLTITTQTGETAHIILSGQDGETLHGFDEFLGNLTATGMTYSIMPERGVPSLDFSESRSPDELDLVCTILYKFYPKFNNDGK
jgi:hypothetical protein